MLRDFIYLDTERIRSFVAQAAGGLTSERVAGSEHQAGGQASGQGRIPLLAEAAAEVDYRYVRSSSETKSLHDYIFEEFHGHLTEERKLKTVPDPSGHWAEVDFLDGQFLQVTGGMKIVDFQGALDTMSAFPLVVDIAAKAAQAGSLPAKAPTKHQSLAISQQVKALPIKQITGFVEKWYGNDIRLKIYPFLDQVERVLVARAVRDLFRYPPSVLASTYGNLINSGWTTVVQVHKNSTSGGPVPAATGQQLDDIMEGLADSLAEVAQTGIRFPAVAATPLAIYREV